MKKVSVIVPVYNVELYLENCINSIINQTYKNLEIILVDDGSPDKCGQICDDFAQKDTRIKVIHKENGGLSSARNAGLDIATGDYVSFIDSDDYLDLNAFSKTIEKLMLTDSDVCMFSHYTISEIETNVHKLPFEKDFYNEEEVRNKVYPKFFGKTKEDGLIEGFVCRQIFKRDVIGDLRFRSEREYFAEDIVFDLELYGRVKSFCVVNDPLYYYRYVSTSLSNKYRENLFEKFEKLIAFMYEVNQQYDLGVQNRILDRIFFSAVGSCLNIKKGEELSKKEKLFSIKQIAQNKYVKESIKTLKREKFKEKIFAWLLKKRAVRLILALI